MRLDIGVSLPTTGEDVPDVVEAARTAERAGFDSVWVGDHLADGRPILESTVALAAAAAVTERVRLGFGVLQLALRHPAWAAKQIGSLQTLSRGRLVLGVGAGGDTPLEWAAAGVPVAERGARTDRALAALPGPGPSWPPAPPPAPRPPPTPAGCHRLPRHRAPGAPATGSGASRSVWRPRPDGAARVAGRRSRAVPARSPPPPRPARPCSPGSACRRPDGHPPTPSRIRPAPPCGRPRPRRGRPLPWSATTHLCPVSCAPAWSAVLEPESSRH